MSWTPATAAIPGGIMFPDLNGHARLDMIWEVPAQVRLHYVPHAINKCWEITIRFTAVFRNAAMSA